MINPLNPPRSGGLVKGGIMMLLALAVIGCGEHSEQRSSVELLRGYQSLPADQLALLDFGSDTIAVKGFAAVLTGYNRSNLLLKVAAVVPSCTCTRVTYDKEVIAPGDSIRINAAFKPGFQGASVTIIGNLSGGQKTIYFSFSPTTHQHPAVSTAGLYQRKRRK